MSLACAVIGSRNYPRPDLVAKFVWRLSVRNPRTVIVSGGAHGPDAWAAHLAGVYELPEPLVIKPDWIKYGRGAGFKRNTEIVKQADLVVAFWDLSSHGTKDSLDKARDMGKPCLIYGPAGETYTVRI